MSLTRRRFLAGTTAALCAPLARGIHAEDSAAGPAFFFVSDTHYLASAEKPADMDASSAEVCARLVDVLNRLPGASLPAEIGGGTVRAVQGVIHGGDLIDSGDKNGAKAEAMMRTEIAAYEKDYGLNGTDGKLKYPVFEVHGNHDSPRSSGHAIERLKERNRARKGLTGISDNALHVSWNWGPLHFINVGITVGPGDGVNKRRRYNPSSSFEFLQADLKRNASDGNRPVVITHHVDSLRYLKKTGEVKGVEWDPEDVKQFGALLAPYNIAMVFYGHTHVRNVWKWTVEDAGKSQALDVFNADNSSHFQSNTQAFLYSELTANTLTIRECITRDRWENISWTPQVWRKELTHAAAAK